jgi:hypothetical protein
MSSDASYYSVNATSTCEPDHDLVYAVLDSAFYTQAMPISVSENNTRKIELYLISTAGRA